MKALLVPGFKGLLLTAFLAAFMSTIDTHLNWGASYITIDLYRRFINRDASEKHYLRFSKLMMILLMAAAAVTATFIQSISAAWEFAFLMGCGIGLVLILRWFWWRINATSEIAALASSTLLASANLLLVQISPSFPVLGFPIGEMPWHIKALIILPITITVWVTATFLTRPVSRERLILFYRTVSPGGLWKPVPERHKNKGQEVLTKRFIGNWVAGLALIIGLNLGVGSLCFGNYIQGIFLISIGLFGLIWILVRRSLIGAAHQDPI
jgi:Na+/proline symporter